MPDPEDLHVDRPAVGEPLLVGTALGLDVRGRTVWHVDTGWVQAQGDGHFPGDDRAVALLVPPGQTDKLVEREGGDRGGAEVPVRDATGQFGVDRQGGGAGCQAQDGFCRGRQDVGDLCGGDRADLGGVLQDDDLR